MSDLGSELLKRCGVTGVIAGVIGAVLLALIIWILAHSTSAPGTPVKILWGLVEYTKPPMQPDSPSASPPTHPAAETPPMPLAEALPVDLQAVPSPLSLAVIHGLTADNYLDAVAELRAHSGLRELRPIESGRPIHESPPDTFFFVFGPSLMIFEHLQGIEALVWLRVSRLQTRPRSFFEVHHRANGQVLLLGYSVELDAGRIRSLTGDHTFQITVTASPWTFFTSLVQLPFDRIVSSKPREIQIDHEQTLKVLDLSLR